MVFCNIKNSPNLNYFFLFSFRVEKKRENVIYVNIIWKFLQEDFNDMDGHPVTSQPAPGQGTSNSNVPIAMPAPNPTNPFASIATESTGLNTSEQTTYTPGN